ncbi:hypothetical protein [Shimia aestuarii]|uniref:hypothetical protein n=1 Tax=Shimia aestuarii TaxID=254406 RepID=UPI001FB49C8A|nr:hypothetical protein [Shimia aestuarii]
MERNVKMKALMSLPMAEGRDAVKRGENFDATAQEARDLERMERAERVSKEPVAATKKAAS